MRSSGLDATADALGQDFADATWCVRRAACCTAAWLPRLPLLSLLPRQGRPRRACSALRCHPPHTPSPPARRYVWQEVEEDAARGADAKALLADAAKDALKEQLVR